MSIIIVLSIVSSILIQNGAGEITVEYEESLNLSESGPDYLEKLRAALLKLPEEYDINDKETLNLTYTIYFPVKTPREALNDVLDVLEEVPFVKVFGYNSSIVSNELKSIILYASISSAESEVTKSDSTISVTDESPNTSSDSTITVTDESQSTISDSIITFTDESQSSISDSTNSTTDPVKEQITPEEYSESDSTNWTETTDNGAQITTERPYDSTLGPSNETTEPEEELKSSISDSTISTPKSEITSESTNNSTEGSTKKPHCNAIANEIFLDKNRRIKENIIDEIIDLIEHGTHCDVASSITIYFQFSTKKKNTNPNFNIKQLKKYLSELEPEAVVQHVDTKSKNKKTTFHIKLTLSSLENSTIFNLPTKFPLVLKHRVDLIDAENLEEKVRQILFYKIYSTRYANRGESLYLTLAFMVKKKGGSKYYKQIKRSIIAELRKYDGISYQSSKFSRKFEKKKKIFLVKVLKTRKVKKLEAEN